MKIYTNNEYEIIAVDNKPENYEHEFETEQTKEDIFEKWCDVCIQGYRYEPQYEILFNDNGCIQTNEQTGELLCKLDKNGNKIFNGYACYPFIDINTLNLIQKQYEESQKREKALTAKVKYLSMIAGAEMEEDNE